MCELKSCLGNEGVSDVQFTGEDSRRDMADSRVRWNTWNGFGKDWRVWYKRCSRLESDRFSPETLFLGWERWRLTGVTVSSRLASRTTASSEVEEGCCLYLKLFWRGCVDLCRCWTSIALKGDWFKTRS